MRHIHYYLKSKMFISPEMFKIFMEARSGQNHDNKIAPHVNLIQLQQILWTCVFLSSLNNTFFSVLIIIFSNKSYFCFNYTKCFFHSCHELFFSGTSNYFSNVYQELFFNWAVNYFSRYREFIFWSTMHCGPCIWSGLVRVFDFLGRHFERGAFKENVKAKHCQGKKRKRFSSFLQNLSRAGSLSLVMRFSGPTI